MLTTFRPLFLCVRDARTDERFMQVYHCLGWNMNQCVSTCRGHYFSWRDAGTHISQPIFGYALDIGLDALFGRSRLQSPFTWCHSFLKVCNRRKVDFIDGPQWLNNLAYKSSCQQSVYLFWSIDWSGSVVEYTFPVWRPFILHIRAEGHTSRATAGCFYTYLSLCKVNVDWYGSIDWLHVGVSVVINFAWTD